MPVAADPRLKRPRKGPEPPAGQALFELPFDALLVACGGLPGFKGDRGVQVGPPLHNARGHVNQALAPLPHRPPPGKTASHRQTGPAPQDFVGDSVARPRVNGIDVQLLQHLEHRVLGLQLAHAPNGRGQTFRQPVSRPL